MLRIGVDLGGTKTEGAVLDEGGAILFCERRPTPAADGYRAIPDNIRAIVHPPPLSRPAPAGALPAGGARGRPAPPPPPPPSRPPSRSTARAAARRSSS